MSVLSLAEANLTARPLVYGIRDGRTRQIVYVGKTINLAKRLNSYRYPSQCHNRALAQWLRENMDFAQCVILEDRPANITEAEKRWIARYRDQLFNLTDGSEANWRHESKPWMGRTGVKCPSAIIISRLISRKHHADVIAEVKRLRRAMSMKERCLFEVGLAMEHYGRYRKEIELWLSYTEGKLLATLEG